MEEVPNTVKNLLVSCEDDIMIKIIIFQIAFVFFSFCNDSVQSKAFRTTVCLLSHILPILQAFCLLLTCCRNSTFWKGKFTKNIDKNTVVNHQQFPCYV